MSDRAYELEWAGRQAPAGPFNPVADPTGSGFVNRFHLGRAGATLSRGFVVDSVAYLNCYRVAPEGLAPPLVCVLGMQTSALPVGPRQLNTLHPGTPVWYARAAQGDYGAILAAEPPASADPSLGLPDWVHQASRCGFHVDKAHEAILRCKNSGGARNWAAGRPADSAGAGEWGAIAETGLRVFLDSFQAQVAADEATGLFVFYHDQLARLAGANLQIFSSGGLSETLDDEGEIAIYRGETPYPWEQLGALRPGVDPTREVADDDSQNGSAYLSSLEPRHDDQQPFHRRVFLGGYLGQGGKDLIAAPPEGTEVARLGEAGSAEERPCGLLEEQRTLTGLYILRSAKGIHSIKQPAIPVPIRLRRPEDARGDSPGNYRAAGRGEAGDPHRVTGQIEATADNAHLQRLAGVADEIARATNWEGEHALAYHSRDWQVPEEAETPLAADYKAPELDKLKDSFPLPPPEPIEREVDHRYGKVSYYQNSSQISQLDDGSIVIRDGWGSSIEMSGGNITFSSAGDVHVRPGRSVVVWAGRDVAIRARNSIDLSATERDIRLKAERNLHALAGNSGEGGLLLESKGEDAYDFEDKVGEDVTSGGVQIKASKGSMVAWARGHYLRATEGGDIFLDADKGQGAIYQHADRAVRYLAGSAADYFGPASDPDASNTFGPDGARVSGTLGVSGRLTAAGGVLAQGDVQVVGGHVSTEQADANGGKVGSLSSAGGGLPAARREVQALGKAAADSARQGGRDYASDLGTAYYGDGRPGDDDTIALAAFSFRTTTQYGAADFECWEAPWQQAARLSSTPLDAWTERPVEAAAQETYPYPGQARMVEEPCLMEQDLALFDPEAGVAVSRADARESYEEPKFKEPTRKKLDGSYLIMPAPSGGSDEGSDE